MIKNLIKIAVTLLAFVVMGCNYSGEIKVLKLAHGLPTTHPVHKAIAFFADQVAELSNGKLTVKIYPSGQLGSERESVESLEIGSLDMTKVNSAVVENFVPSLSVLSLPYLFESTQHRWNVFNSDIGKKLLTDGEDIWIHGLTFYETGTRNFYLVKDSVYVPEDLKGLKIRVMRSNYSIKGVEALGASVAPISFGELYTALAAGVVDGAENNIPTFYSSRHWEICKYFVLDGHSAPSDMLLISTHTWNKLSEQQKEWLHTAAERSVIFQKKLWQDSEKEFLEIIQKGGVTVVYPDTLKFKQAVIPFYENLKQENPELFRLAQTIKKMAGD